MDYYIFLSKNSRFTKCGLCTLLKDINRSTRDADLKKEMHEIRKFHNEQQMYVNSNLSLIMVFLFKF
jgi:hypothetical protein